ncbi:cytochrome P450 [Glonium stellatum]|uniref:Cytochrome P450 n=1 Tax=Glonium stellatum TaxID=574774 RepID=A0A8E2JQG0_9PEZI|nr:cytochrome P450 [Glonium stellatum]
MFEILKTSSSLLIYVVTNPRHVGEVYRNTTTLSFDTFIQDLMLSCGTSVQAADKSSKQPPPYPEDALMSGLNPQNKSIINLAIDFHHIQLLPGPDSQVEYLSAKFLHEISESLKWDILVSDKILAGEKNSDTMETSLIKWAGSVLIKAGTKAYWGDRLWKIAPDLLDSFYEFDRGIWKLLFHYPKVFSGDALAARDKIIDALTKYFQLPRKERDDIAWFTRSLETESRLVGLDERDMAASTLILYFVINGNTYKLCFWVLCHIITKPELLTSIKAEISQQSMGSEPNIEHLTQSCPILNSVLQEVLRLYTSSASMRFISEDTIIGGKLLRKGRKIMIPYRQLHEDSVVWGADSPDFEQSRWLKNASLRRNGCFRPFGGGATLCAGRSVAQQEVLFFVGLVLTRYNLEVVSMQGGKEGFPRVDALKPTLGMMSPVYGDDCVVKVSRRKEGEFDGSLHG